MKKVEKLKLTGNETKEVIFLGNDIIKMKGRKTAIVITGEYKTSDEQEIYLLRELRFPEKEVKK